jgi:hypothetical protein
MIPFGPSGLEGIMAQRRIGQEAFRFAYDALCVEKAIEAAGGTARLLRKRHRWLPAKALEAHNRRLRPVRSRIEKIFGTWKRSYYFRCMRWFGLPAKSILRSSLQHHTLLAAARRLNGFEQRRKAKPFSRRLSQIIKTDSQQSRSLRRHRTAQPTIFERRSPSCLSPLAARFNPSYRLKRRHRTQVSKQFRTIGHRLDAPTTRSHSGKQRSFSTA